MKDLDIYIKESLSLDMKLNETSLLDDDMLDQSDEVVAKVSSIGNEYRISNINDTHGDLLDHIDKSVLKKIKSPWNANEFDLYKPHPRHAFRRRVLKPTKLCIQLANAILSLNKDHLYIGKLDKNNDIYKLFYTLFEKWINKDNVRLTVNVEKLLSRIMIKVSCVSINYHYDIKENREFIITLVPNTYKPEWN